MKKVSWVVVIAGAVVGLAAVVLTHLGNPANMGFCIACFLRDITGAVGMHGAAKVQYVRPEIIGLVLGAFIMSVATKEFRAKAGSSPATRFVLGAFVIMEILDHVTKAVIPAVASLYFDFFDGLLQAYVFVCLTGMYIKEATEVAER